MVRRIDDNGLVLSIVKLNGKLELHFVSDDTFSAQYTLYGTDIEDTVEMDHAREAAAGQPVVSLGLEMFIENAQGFLDVRFEGAVGSMLAFQYDGRDGEDPSGYDDTAILRLEPPPGIAAGAISNLRAPLQGDGPLLGGQEARGARDDAKVQSLRQGTRSAQVQTMETLVTHSGVQTKRKRIVNTGAQDATAPRPPRKMSAFMPPNVDIPGMQQSTSTETNSTWKRLTPSTEVPHTFTNAVATVFQTFNEPRDPYCQKRLAEPAADYRAYKHIFIEGYRNGDDKEEEGRLHVDLAHHVLLWESYDDYDRGAKLTLDRLDLPRCEVVHKHLEHAHYFGDHTIQLSQNNSDCTFFCMDYKIYETRIYGNIVGNGDERFHFQGDGRVLVVLDAIEKCLELKARSVAPRMD
ncbi:hypothetical protein HBI23_027330 [Parastagonospora nodorum]|nr:hypothetical protein HBI79_011730 [Parastagonospora nodorum]KAH5337974.1 hypothetical protein HBI12_021470 [Parastagonospora nodorum]KAH5446887.1 hypothetical protein HBI47_018230 [Parastagonospora nodorum]KAH5688703.1 hypothetical protein HBI23_027330 [Parastagonospora nodorum]KAH6065429.1 hypothetical protein HBI67_127820 [Parastagonospora nodorum]